MTVSQAVLFESFPRREAGTAMALFGLGVMVGPTIGPTLGGWLTDNYGWPWIFYVNIPVGILAAAMIAGYVHDPEHQRKPPSIDYMGIALLAVSVRHRQWRGRAGQRGDAQQCWARWTRADCAVDGSADGCHPDGLC